MFRFAGKTELGSPFETFASELISKYLPSPLVGIVSANPLSLAADAMRQYAFAGQPIQQSLLLNILLAGVPLALIGAISYLTALHMIRVRGKL